MKRGYPFLQSSLRLTAMAVIGLSGNGSAGLAQILPFEQEKLEVHESVIGEGCDIGRHAKLKRTILDKFVRIDPYVKIGYDLEHDRKRGLTVTESGIVAVPKGMHIKE